MTSNIKNDSANQQSDGESSTALTTTLSAVCDAISGTSLPAPIRNNAFKAFNQLCTAVIDIPVAYLEGKAAELRAETEARKNIIAASGTQIAQSLNVDQAFAKAAAIKYASKIVREQINLDKISQIAAIELINDKNSTEEQIASPGINHEIDQDWLNTFEEQAGKKSSDEMQALFGKILASEIIKPNAFSIKTLKLMGQMDTKTAKAFQRLCSIASTLEVGGHIVDSRVISLGGNAAGNALQKFGLPFSVLNELQEYGLIISDYNSYMNYAQALVIGNTVAMPFRHQTSQWALRSVQPDKIVGALNIHGVSLSSTGRELLNVVEVIPNVQYKNELIDFFAKKELALVPVTSANKR